MKKHISDSRNEPKRRNRVFLILMIFAGILLLTGAGFLLVEPIKTMRREKITDDAINAMASQMSEAQASAGPSATYDPDSEIEALIEADLGDTAFDYSPAFPDYITENEASLYALGKRIKELTEEYDAIKAEVLEKMIEHNDKSFDTGDLLITVVAPTVRETFDSKRFKADHADLYAGYLKQSTTKESLKLTLR